MSRILLVTSSPRGAASHSSRIARALADQLASGDPRSSVVVRDLSKEPLPHIGEEFGSRAGRIGASLRGAGPRAHGGSDSVS